MSVDVYDLLEQMAQTGTAPSDGCSAFGVGYEDAMERIKKTYLFRMFNRGRSAEKFVVGPYGSGKTHFLRQLMEMARDNDCVTSEVQLNKDLDFTKSMLVYREIVREIRVPGSTGHGVRNLLQAVCSRVRSLAPSKEQENVTLSAWVTGLDEMDFRLEPYARVLQKALTAYAMEEEAAFDVACNWLSGEMQDRSLAKQLGTSPVAQAEQNLFAKRAQQTLFQFIKHASYRGTVVCLDEAEQGLSQNSKKTDTILSMLMAGINATTDLRNGAALVVYAITPDIAEKMELLAALSQRLADPAPNYGFFNGNTLAPKIDLTTRRDDPQQELTRMGRRLVELTYELLAEDISVPQSDVLEAVRDIAKQVLQEDITSSNRRAMIKQTSALLLNLVETGTLSLTPHQPSPVEEDEV